MDNKVHPQNSSELINDTFNKKIIDLNTIPTSPGCYLFYDEKGKVIYVGKSNNLRARIRTYYQLNDTRYHIRFLISKAHKIDYLITKNEKEALLLENTLIKQHKPRYNIRLKDDKNFLSLRIDPSEKYPRLTFVRKPKNDNALYFGPFHVASAIRELYKQLHFVVPLRRCSDNMFNNRTRPCLYYQLGTCPAPCVGYINEDDYAKLVNQAILVLQGNTEALEKELTLEIKKEAEQLHFEKAGLLRDRLFALRKIMEPQKTILNNYSRNIDVWGFYSSDKIAVFLILFYQEGKLIGSYNFTIKLPTEIPISEFLSSLLLELYTHNLSVPEEILLPIHIQETSQLETILTEKKGTKVKITSSTKGKNTELLDLALKNAETKFREEYNLQTNQGAILQEIQNILHIPRIPIRIECFDASTLQGNNTVVGMVVFENGIPKKSDYRRFSTKTSNINDDYFALRDALTRRFRDLTDLPLPDLLLIDGGKGQLNVALSVLNDLSISDVYCVSIAKARNYSFSKNNSSSQERFFTPNRCNPIIIKNKTSNALLLLQRIRDETHRFSIQYHRKKRLVKDLSSSINISGLGKNTIEKLLKHFKSFDKIRNASIQELKYVKGIGDTLATLIYNYFQTSQNNHK